MDPVLAGGIDHVGPLLLVAAPLVAALLLLASARWGRGALDALTLATTLGVAAGVAALAPAVLAHGRVTTELPALLGRLTFTLDAVGLLFAVVTASVWLCATVYAGAYLRRDGRELRYHLTSLVSLSAMLGIVVAGDLITLYVFFEWLGLSAYLFVVHVGGAAAERAGIKYLVMTLLGGFAVLTGVLLVHALGGGDLAATVPVVPGREALRALAALFLVVGFGVKAGALGLHVWLPDAHTVAPAPGSALLSGVMIKAGAYGILRTVGSLYGIEADAAATALSQGESLGLTLLWWGTATMSVGVVMALGQNEAKRLLAYSSVSQMGFILAGIGAARYLGGDGAIGYAGALLHVTNHALFKGLLFLAVGAVIHATGVGDLRRLGGLARRMPWTFGFLLVASAGIAGVPLFNGFVSKSVLHHAIAHAAEHGHAPGLAWTERVFTITTVGTAAALIKLIAMTFLGPARSDAAARAVREAPMRMRLAMGALSVAVLAMGLRPQIVAPLLELGLEAWRLPTTEVGTWLASPIGHPGDLRAALTALALGALVHVVAARTRAYELVPPAWLSLDRIITGGVRAGAEGVRRWTLTRSAWVGASHAFAAHERDVLRRAAARSPALGPRPWLGWPHRALAHIERAAAAWAAFGAAAAAVSRRLDETGRLDESRRLSREARRARADVEQGAGRDRFVLAARRGIQRQSRDIGLNMGVLFLVWLLFLATVALRAGG